MKKGSSVAPPTAIVLFTYTQKDIKMEIITEQGSPAWHALRANKIGASDAACILGIGFKSAEKLWREKLGLDEVYVNEAMKRGSTLEPKARKAFEDIIGHKFSAAVYIHDENQWMMASLDGINAEKTALLEIKCGNEKLHEQAKNGIVPAYYLSQMQHQMYVTGVDRCYYFSYNGEEGATVIINRDDKFLSDYLPKARAFWESLQTFTKPESAYMEIDTLEWRELAERYRAIQKVRNELDEEEKGIRDQLAIISNGMPAKGYGLTFMKASRKGSVAYDQIPELRNVDLEQYRKPGSEYWRLLSSDPKQSIE